MAVVALHIKYYDFWYFCSDFQWLTAKYKVLGSTDNTAPLSHIILSAEKKIAKWHGVNASKFAHYKTILKCVQAQNMCNWSQIETLINIHCIILYLSIYLNFKSFTPQKWFRKLYTTDCHNNQVFTVWRWEKSSSF